MPVYDYQCKNCGYIIKDIEIPIRSRDSLNLTCKDCGKHLMSRLPSASHFKINGYRADDKSYK